MIIYDIKLIFFQEMRQLYAGYDKLQLEIVQFEDVMVKTYFDVLPRSNSITETYPARTTTISIRVSQYLVGKLKQLFFWLDAYILTFHTAYAQMIVPFQPSDTLKEIIGYVYERVGYLMCFEEEAYGVFDADKSTYLIS